MFRLCGFGHREIHNMVAAPRYNQEAQFAAFITERTVGCPTHYVFAVDTRVDSLKMIRPVKPSKPTFIGLLIQHNVCFVPLIARPHVAEEAVEFEAVPFLSFFISHRKLLLAVLRGWLVSVGCQYPTDAAVAAFRLSIL